MALSSRNRTSMYDENAPHAGKLPVAGNQAPRVGASGNAFPGKPNVGLKQSTSDRRILSDISNTKGPSHSAFGTPRPSPKPGFGPYREGRTTKGVENENLRPHSSQKPAGRIPLRGIVNESVPVQASKEVSSEAAQLKANLKSGSPKRLGSKATARIRLTQEELRLAEEWAKEDISLERIHFSGEDMEALREKLIESEIEEKIKAIRNYRGPPPAPAVCLPLDFSLVVDDSLREADGSLKLDPIREEAMFSTFDTLEIIKEDDSDIDDQILSAGRVLVEDDYPGVPDNWGLREDVASVR